MDNPKSLAGVNDAPEQSNDYLLKHLDYIQAAISRMASNSFLIKGWTVVLTSGVLAFLSKEGSPKRVWISLPPVLIFWGLDAYFLQKEGLFRCLFDKVRANPLRSLREVDFSMDTRPYRNDARSWLASAFSPTLVAFYVSLSITILLVWALA